MKNSMKFIGVAVAIIGVTALGFLGRQTAEAASDILDGSVAEMDTIGNGMANIAFPNFGVANTGNDLWYTVKGRYSRTVTKEKLKMAQSLDDLISNYPTNWISEYVSVEISSNTNGKETKAMGADAILNEGQKALFNSVGLSDDVNIIVKYKIKNSVTSKLEPDEMNIFMTVVPEVEAEFVGGYDALIRYLKDKSVCRLSSKNINADQQLKINFRVNELGEIDNVVMANSSGEEAVDQFLMELIENMPKWKPAENADGEKVPQPFEFMIGHPGC